jgi:hypothetical protein
VANAVNVGYYPFKIKSGVNTHLYTCTNPVKIKEDLAQGQNVAAQSTRNPSCSDNPPLRPSVDGYVYVYARGSGNQGWVPSSALEFTGYTDQTCAAGPADVDYQIKGNPYDSCKSTICHPDAKGNGGQSCTAVNGTSDGKDDCGGKRVSIARTVSATDMYLRYAPFSTSMRYLHKGDKVKVMYDNLKGWSFVQVTYSTCPGLTPVGSRGWCQTEYLK